MLYEQMRAIQQQLNTELASDDGQDSSSEIASDDEFFCFGAAAQADMYLTETSRGIECLLKFLGI